jgi:hypothetical protein
MPSPFCNSELQDIASPSNNLGQTAIPTPPPERTYHSPDSLHSCVSPQHSASATSDSYIKGSSLEESPVSSPSSSYAGDIRSPAMEDYDSELPKFIKKERESCIRSTNISNEERKSLSHEGETSSTGTVVTPCEQNVPKNIKLPQSKFVVFEYLAVAIHYKFFIVLQGRVVCSCGNFFMHFSMILTEDTGS